jgi:hypothetical protein
METTQELILFSIFNVVFTALVGGIVVYVIQKKIDASIQKSLFEHQTKFSAIHAKRVETLENLYRKFYVFEEAFVQLILQATNYRLAGSGSAEKLNLDALNKIEEYHSSLDECEEYYRNNHMFLSTEMASTVSKLILRARMTTILRAMMIRIIENNNEPTLIDSFNVIAKGLDFSLYQLNLEKPDYDAALYQMLVTMKNDANILESFYRSVAHPK